MIDYMAVGGVKIVTLFDRSGETMSILQALKTLLQLH